MMMCMCMCMMMCMMSVMGGGPFGALFGGLGSGLSAAGDVVSGEAFKPKLNEITGTDKDKMMCVFALGTKGKRGKVVDPATITKCKSMGCPGYPDDVANCDFSTQFLVKN